MNFQIVEVDCTFPNTMEIDGEAVDVLEIEVPMFRNIFKGNLNHLPFGRNPRLQEFIDFTYGKGFPAFVPFLVGHFNDE